MRVTLPCKASEVETGAEVPLSSEPHAQAMNRSSLTCQMLASLLQRTMKHVNARPQTPNKSPNSLSLQLKL